MTQSNCMLICRFFFFPSFKHSWSCCPGIHHFSVVSPVASIWQCIIYWWQCFPPRPAGIHSTGGSTEPVPVISLRCWEGTVPLPLKRAFSRWTFLSAEFLICVLHWFLLGEGWDPSAFLVFFGTCKWGRDCGYIVLIGRSGCVQICMCVLLTAMLEQWLCDSYTAHLANGKQHFTLFF